MSESFNIMKDFKTKFTDQPLLISAYLSFTMMLTILNLLMMAKFHATDPKTMQLAGKVSTFALIPVTFWIWGPALDSLSDYIRAKYTDHEVTPAYE